MRNSLKLKIALLLSLLVFSGMILAPSVYNDLPNWWKKDLSPGELKKGLDLQGGVHLVLRVDLDKAIENSLEFTLNDLKNSLAEKNIKAVRIKTDQENKAVFALPNNDAVAVAQQIVSDKFDDINLEVQAGNGGFPKITLSLKKEKIDYIRQNSVDQALEIIRNRIDQFGVAEPVIIKQGEDNIVVQLPGLDEPERAQKLIGQTAQLEFKLVANDSGVNLPGMIKRAIDSGQWQEGGDRKELNLVLQAQLPENTEIYFQNIKDKETQKETEVPILLESPVLMTGEMIKNAQMRFDGRFNQPYVSLDLTNQGGKLFAKITKDNIHRRLAIVLDGKVRSAPTIQSEILGGSAQITGQFTSKEATDLAITLRAGSLPAPVEFIQSLTVGASLGQDSINKGLKSGIFGALMVLVFMVIYYRLAGVIADIALILNIFFLFTGLAMLGATLTLPGIAGIILSIGMAVDANVLIYERMREEFALGKSVRSGIEAGFDKAYWSIVDSQVTTLITAVALFIFGTGPIKGFAVTLSLGIIFNLFAVLFCSRLFFEILYSRKKLKKLTFMQVFKDPSFDFMKVKKVAFTISAILVILGLISFVEIIRGDANLGVDFSGGSLLQYKAEQPFSMEEIRHSLSESGYPNANIQEVKNEHRLIVKVRQAKETVGDISQEITSILTQKHPELKFSLESKSEIGSSISTILRNKAIMAIAIALLGVLVYLAIRFDFSFGLAAAAATFHDVLAVLGVCWLANKEINLLLVTALLTLAGYSLNDSVVVFDRIRENMHKMVKSKFSDIINTSINQTISRSIITSLTTCMVLLSLFLFGGQAIHDFSFTLLVGIIIGTYSSIFIASPLLTLKKRENQL